MRKLLKGCAVMFLASFLLLSIIAVFTPDTKEPTSDSQETEQTAEEQEEPAAVIDSAMVLKLKGLFTETTDEFTGRTWVYHKNTPKYRNRKAIYMYFEMLDGKPVNPRVVFQYESDDWLFIQKIGISCEAGVWTVEPQDMERDNDVRIWEWCDEPIQAYQIPMFNAMTAGDPVKVRFYGKQYVDDVTFSPDKLKALTDIYNYYIALGGRFE